MRWLILLTVIIGTFLSRLDQTIVNLAMPKIIEGFRITVSSAGWIATAYILANAVFVPIWGKLGDTLGRKKIYIIGFIVFTIGSVLAGLAWNLTSMIVFRVIQAIAGSADYPTAMAILAVTFPEGKERAQALGIWSSSFAAAAVFGPLIGGPLIDHFGWRSVFLINLPVGLIGLAMAMTFIKESIADSKEKKFDWWGSITLGLALTALVLVLDRGMSWGWLSLRSIASYAAIMFFGLIFVMIEQRNPEPIVDLKFFRNPVFVNAIINNFIVFMGMMGSVFLIPIFAETFLGYDATQTGLLFIPMAFLIVLASPIGASLSGKVESRYVIAGSTFIAAIGFFLFHYLDPRSTPRDIIIPLSVMAFGMGIGMAQRTGVIAAAVPRKEIGIASSVLALARNIAGAFGIAVFGTILNKSIESNVLAIAKSSSLHDQTALNYQRFVSLIALKAQISAYDTVFLVSSAIVAIGAIITLAMKAGNDKEKIDVAVMVEA